MAQNFIDIMELKLLPEKYIQDICYFLYILIVFTLFFIVIVLLAIIVDNLFFYIYMENISIFICDTDLFDFLFLGCILAL